MYLLGDYNGAGGPSLCPGALFVFIWHSFFMLGQKLQLKIETKGKSFVKKHDEILFLLFRLIIYVIVCNWLIQVPTVSDPTIQLVLWIEAINYLIIFAFLLLFPSLSDFRLFEEN